jgi:RND family efflux transporter MFP subunit
VALVAPIAGKITHLDVTRGQSVERTQVLLEVEDLRSVWVTANVPESDATKVRTGAAVRVTSGGREFAGVVQVLGASVDAKTRSLPTQCLVVAQEQLRPGMFATVQVSVGPRFRSVVVPKTAIVMEGGEAGVFVQNGSAFVRRAVKLGMESGPMVAVVSGVRVGEVVASEGAFVLASEAKKSDLKGHDH